jgi:predicted N-acetyltransferase YhbS
VCDHRGVAIRLSTPRVGGLDDVVRELGEWQRDDAPMQLHPGDLGWFWRWGAEATAAAVRSWSEDGRLLAVGLLDGPELLRLTTAPEVRHDAELAQRLVVDVVDPARGVLPSGPVSVEAPNGSLVADRLLDEVGWDAGEAWTPLHRDLKEPVEDPGLRVEVVGPRTAPDHAAVHRSAFGSPTFTDERWRAMATGVPYRDARGLIAYDDEGDAVAAATVWSAGLGRPGLLEPMGVHAERRRRGHGRAICVAAAAALRRLGASSAIAAAVVTYESAGFRRQPERRDRSRS